MPEPSSFPLQLMIVDSPSTGIGPSPERVAEPNVSDVPSLVRAVATLAELSDAEALNLARILLDGEHVTVAVQSGHRVLWVRPEGGQGRARAGKDVSGT